MRRSWSRFAQRCPLRLAGAGPRHPPFREPTLPRRRFPASFRASSAAHARKTNGVPDEPPRGADLRAARGAGSRASALC